jgi:perosamine synthetase
LRGSDLLTLNHEPDEVKSIYWMVTAIVDPSLRMTKTDLLGRMSSDGIDCRPFFYPLSSLPAYSGTPRATLARERNVHAYALSEAGLNLPSGFNMTREKVAYVCERLLAHLASAAPALSASAR